MKKSFKLLALLLAVVMALSIFAGCASTTPKNDAPAADEPSTDTPATDAPAEGEDDDFVELNFYIMNSPVIDQDRVMEKANEIIKDKINAKLNIICVDPGTYAEKINLMIATGEEFDLCFMANWGDMNFFENAAKGAFVPMNDLFDKYAPETYSRIPEGLWQGVTVNGNIYASVNYQQWGVAARKGYAVRMDIAEEVGFDWTQLKGMDPITALKTLEPFFEEAIKLHPEMIGWETSATYSFFLNDPLYWDMEPVGDTTQPGWISYSDPTKVINQFETEEFAQYCDIMREYYEKGLVRSDGATLQDAGPDRTAGRILAQWNYSWPDMIDYPPTGVEELTVQGFADANYTPPSMSMMQPGEGPAAQVSTTRTVIPAAAGPTACVAISATSKHPERAMQLIELLNTDDELFNLIQWGEEGTDWYLDDNGMQQLVDGKYNFNWNEWEIGQSYDPDFARSNFGLSDNANYVDTRAKQQIIFDADLNADPSPVSGFEFDPSPVKTEMANCSAIISEMIPVLSNGAADPATYLPQFLQRLHDAGVDTIIAEKQAQLDAWHAANN